jgi:hypothetical protein
MPVNHYFNHTRTVSEQDLIQDLIDESIAMYGHSVYYVPRNDGNIDAFLGEDPLANFSEAFEIEMYVKSFDAFQGQSEFIGKFGLHIEDQIILSVSERRFRNAVRAQSAISFTRPRENDLIFIEMTPTNRYLFNIRFVENKEALFQLGSLYTYELRCEMMNFNNERVNTGVEEINDAASRFAYAINLDMQTGGSGTFSETETVYQGANVASATATGMVSSWNATTRVLQVQQITGTFAGNTAVIGNTSGASWTVVNETPNTTPTVNDPITDNEFLQGNPLSVVVTRGTRPNPD